MSINVQDYGAVGDGVTDDTTAFNNATAAAAAANTFLYVPQGIYSVDTLTGYWNDSMTGMPVAGIIGDGRGSELRSRSGGHVLEFGTGTNLPGFVMRDFTVRGAGYNSGTGKGIYAHDCTQFYRIMACNVQIADCGSHGLYFSGGFNLYFDNLNIGTCGDDAFYFTTPDPSPGNVMVSCYFGRVSSGKYAMNIGGGYWTLIAVNGVDSDETEDWVAAGWAKFGAHGIGYPVVILIGCNVEDFAEYGINIFGGRVSIHSTEILTRVDAVDAVAIQFPEETPCYLHDFRQVGAKSGANWKNDHPFHCNKATANVYWDIIQTEYIGTNYSKIWDDTDALSLSMPYAYHAYSYATREYHWNYLSIDTLSIGTVSLGGGVGVLGIANATTVPSSSPSGGGVLYVQGGALKYKGSSGTVTTLAPA